MIESFLHFVWKFQYFNKENLKSASGETINIIHPGHHNHNSGPDFLNAKILLNEIKWHGQVEIHYKSSQWDQHQHQDDQAYNNVVLHVVWGHDKDIQRADGTTIPTLELKDRIDPDLVVQYQKLVNNPDPIPCTPLVPKVPELNWYTMLDRTLMQRMETKSAIIDELLAKNNNDWEETAYQLVSRSFGFKVNNDAFLRLSQSIPYKIIQKHTDQPFQIESLLFGQAGLLEEKSEDEYLQRLRKEYDFLAHKYHLNDKKMGGFEWRFLRLRPANFPTIRLAQLAQLLSRRKNMFGFFKDCDSLVILRNFLAVQQGEYWQTHYHFGKTYKAPGKGLGKSSVENLIINTVAPLMISYGLKMEQQNYVEQAINLLQELPPEKNKITDLYRNLELPVKNAFDSQAYIELHNSYCLRKRCTDCTIGTFLLKR